MFIVLKTLGLFRGRGGSPATLFLALIICTPIAAAAAKPVHIGSAETELTLVPGKDGPRVIRLALKDGGTWEGQSDDPLIDHVELDGRKRELHWRFNDAASKSSPGLVQLVYDSENPRL